MTIASSNTIASLVARIREAEAVMRPDRREAIEAVQTSWAPIARQTLHEWLADMPPLMLLIDMAARAAATRPGNVFWVGRSCWPYAPSLARGNAGEVDLLRRSVFVDVPKRRGDVRAWTLDLILRSPAAGAVVADGRQFDMAQSRRLQLAAESGTALAMLWRHESERGSISVAHHRWHVTPMAASTEPHGQALPGGDAIRRQRGPRWRIEQVRCKIGASEAAIVRQTVNGEVMEARGLAADQDRDGQNPSRVRAGTARVFVVEHDDAQGVVPVPADVVDRPRAASLSQIA
jgi:hypothetical protein